MIFNFNSDEARLDYKLIHRTLLSRNRIYRVCISLDTDVTSYAIF